MSRRGDKNLIRAMNRNLVLNLLITVGALSRSEIARRSGLGNATVTEITAELVSRSLVEEVGEGESTGGRRPLLLRLNARAGYVVGVKLMEDALTCAVTDLHAKVLFHEMYPLGTDHALPAVQRAFIKAVTVAIEQAGIRPEQILGIGIGLAGVVDSVRGLIRYSPYFGWRDADFASAISTHFALPVYLENDVNTLTLAEQWFGHGRGVDNFAVVTVGRGIGSGYVLNGQFCHDAAGEIGHTTLMYDGPLCSCGKRGCLEALAADPAVVYEYSLTVPRRELSLSDVVNAAENGDENARRFLKHAGTYLGIGIANLINTLSPKLVVISGEGLRGGPLRIEAMYAAIAENVFAGLAERTQIVTELIADETWARGAACVVLNEIFKSPMVGESDIIDRLVLKAV